MSSDSQLIEGLLYEEEGPTLDFKRDQYPFVGATDEDKGELLKDILSFANAWRREDAYILVGVEDVRGGRGVVHGVSVHLDEASVQQFVNSKMQRPVEFAYRAVTHDGKQVGVIHVPLQQRPLYLKKNFGKLKKDVVYLRRGSSTAEAAPDEVAKMGELALPFRQSALPEPAKPRLQLTPTWVRYPIYPKAPSEDLYHEASAQARISAKVDPPTFCVVQMSNEPPVRTPISTTAERVKAIVSYYLDDQPNVHLRIRGGWLTNRHPHGPEWMPPLSDEPATIESGAPKLLAILVQFPEETEPPRCHALDASSCSYPKWQHPSLRLSAGRIRVHVRVESQWEVRELEFLLNAIPGGHYACE